MSRRCDSFTGIGNRCATYCFGRGRWIRLGTRIVPTARAVPQPAAVPCGSVTVLGGARRDRGASRIAYSWLRDIKGYWHIAGPALSSTSLMMVHKSWAEPLAEPLPPSVLTWDADGVSAAG